MREKEKTKYCSNQSDAETLAVLFPDLSHSHTRNDNVFLLAVDVFNLFPTNGAGDEEIALRHEIVV